MTVFDRKLANLGLYTSQTIAKWISISTHQEPYEKVSISPHENVEASGGWPLQHVNNEQCVIYKDEI